MGETAPFWRFSAASYPDLQETIPDRPTRKYIKGTSNGSSSDALEVNPVTYACAVSL